MKITNKLKTMPLCAWPRELRNKKYKIRYTQSVDNTRGRIDKDKVEP